MKNNNSKGMRYPALNDLIKRANNKYELVLATAKRAREIIDGKDPLVHVVINNPISIATEEIAEDLVKLDNKVLDEKYGKRANLSGMTVSTTEIVEPQSEEQIENS